MAAAAALALTILAGVAIAGCSGASSASSETPGLGHPRLVRLPDGRRINLQCGGVGAPTVIFEGGYGATSRAWDRIAPQVARTTRACVYDRAGLGRSDPGPPPRDGAAIAADLDQALRAAGIGGPFVMVGHSAGALYVRLFADRRPEDVVGMVLVEPSVEHEDRRFSAAFGPGAGGVERLRDQALACLAAAEHRPSPATGPDLESCPPLAGTDATARAAAARSASTWRTNLSELDTLWSSTSDEVDRGRRSYGDMPLIVLTAGEAYDSVPAGPDREAVRALWARLHRELAARSTRGSAQLVAGATHMMILDAPGTVVAAIEDVVAAARREKPARGPGGPYGAGTLSPDPLKEGQSPTRQSRVPLVGPDCGL